jgi:phage-related protein
MDIYNIPAWSALTFYAKNSIVLVNNYYYYALADHSSTTWTTDVANNLWGGTLNYNGEIRPNFIWKTSYGYRIPIKPVVKNIRFGDSYVQDIPDNISNTMLTLNLEFNDRDLNEATAILHFLHARKGAEKFFFIPPSPYNVIKKFICPEFDSGQGFYDKYSIVATFEERVV